MASAAEGIATSTGKARWDRSTIWGMLRNPAYAGRAAYLKTGRVDGTPALNRVARRQGRAVSPHARSRPRPTEDWIEIAVPAIVDEDTFAAAARRLEDNRRFSARNTKEPSLLMGLVSCQSCGYAYYRTSTRTKTRKLYYYRCLGSDDYRYEHGRVCDNRPVRADFLDDVVWGQVTALLADPRMVQAELDRRLAELRAANPATAERSRLELELTRVTKSVARLVQAYQEDLLTLDELRARMPDLRAKETSLRSSLASLDAQLVDRDTYLKLAENLEGFLGRLRDTAGTATIEDRQKVLRSVVKEVLVGPERVIVRHTIPMGGHPFRPAGYRLRLRRHEITLRVFLIGVLHAHPLLRGQRKVLPPDAQTGTPPRRPGCARARRSDGRRGQPEPPVGSSGTGGWRRSMSIASLGESPEARTRSHTSSRHEAIVKRSPTPRTSSAAAASYHRSRSPPAISTGLWIICSSAHSRWKSAGPGVPHHWPRVGRPPARGSSGADATRHPGDRDALSEFSAASNEHPGLGPSGAGHAFAVDRSTSWVMGTRAGTRFSHAVGDVLVQIPRSRTSPGCHVHSTDLVVIVTSFESALRHAPFVARTTYRYVVEKSTTLSV